MKALAILAALSLAGCGSAKYAVKFEPASSEKETPEQAYVCVRSSEDNAKDPSGHTMTCVDYNLAMQAIQAADHGRRGAAANRNEI